MGVPFLWGTFKSPWTCPNAVKARRSFKFLSKLLQTLKAAKQDSQKTWRLKNDYLHSASNTCINKFVYKNLEKKVLSANKCKSEQYYDYIQKLPKTTTTLFEKNVTFCSSYKTAKIKKGNDLLWSIKTRNWYFCKQELISVNLLSKSWLYRTSWEHFNPCLDYLLLFWWNQFLTWSNTPCSGSFEVPSRFISRKSKL